MKKFIFLTLGFVLIINIGYYLNENVKKAAAGTIGYSCYYQPWIGRCMFYNNSMNDAFKEIRQEYRKNGDTSQAFRQDKEWIKLENKDNRDYAIIEMSGNLFTILVSIAALFTWIIRRKRNKDIRWFDWLLLITSLFYMRETVVIGTSLLFHYNLCNEAKIWFYLGLNWGYSKIFFLSLGLIWLIYFNFRIVPKRSRIIFFISGFLGSIFGFYLLTRYIGYLL